MSMTSRISGTSRLERIAVLRMNAFQKEQDAKRYSFGHWAPVLLYLTRLDRFIQGISVSYRNSMGFSGSHTRCATVENPIPLGFRVGPSPTYCARTADGPWLLASASAYQN